MVSKSGPQSPIKRAVLNRLADVAGFDPLTASEIGDRAGDFEDAVVGSSTQMQVLHRMAKHLGGSFVEHAELFDLAMTHPRIGCGFAST